MHRGGSFHERHAVRRTAGTATEEPEPEPESQTTTFLMVAVIVGEGNTGKSTLVNALLGQVLLPMSNDKRTSAVTTIHAGNQDRSRCRRSSKDLPTQWEGLGPIDP
eukprot:COSAG06_NODE_31900_length_514_cov_0.874699_1_plen_105_part_10